MTLKQRLYGMALPLALAFATLFGSASAAHASLKVCNNTSKTVWYTHTIWNSSCHSPERWRDHGWWKFAPKECKTLESQSMASQYFYYHAYSTDGALVWSSSSYNWMVDTTAHDICWNDKVLCQLGGGGTCPGTTWINHREKYSSSRDYTLTLNP